LYKGQRTGYGRKYELTLNWFCDVANDFTNFTVHKTWCITGLAGPLHMPSDGGFMTASGLVYRYT